MRRALPALLLLVLTVTACGEDRSVTQAPPHHPHSTTHGASPSPPNDPPFDPPVETGKSITVEITYRQAPNGPIYSEGSIPEIQLLDAQRHVIATKQVRTEGPVRFGHLVQGTYQLAPALRPCDANCGYLDGRLDGCRATIHLVDSLRATVSFKVGSPCRIST